MTPKDLSQIKSNSSIRHSTVEDIKFIHSWLEEQSYRQISGSFLCNWNLTELSHEEGGLLVYIDESIGKPIAYQWGGLVRPGIIEVRHDMRGKGIGRQLVEQRVNEAYNNDECLLFIQCKPSTSIPFWSHMGFTLLEQNNGDNYAFRILEKTHQLPVNAKLVSVAIRFYPESKVWCDTTQPIELATPQAVLTTDNIAHLKNRVYFFKRIYPDIGDPVVEIIVDGKVLICDKAKYVEASQFGVCRCTNGFYIDRLLLKSL